MSERELLDAFDRIYDSTYHQTLLYITSKCGNAGDIADIMQETYGELYRVLLKKGTGYIQHPGAFVLRLARTKLAGHYSLLERMGWLMPLSGAFARDVEEESVGDLWQGDVPDLSILAENRSLLREIAAFVRTKPRDTQKMFYLHFVLEQTTAEIAGMMKLPEATVKSRLRRTILELRSLYGKVGKSDE